MEGLSYKKKLKWLWIVVILTLLLCYQFAIRRTISEYAMARSTENTGAPALSVMSMEELRSRDAQLTRLYHRFLLDSLASDKNLLSIAGNFCKANSLRLKEYRPIGSVEEDGRQVLTRTIRVEGGFVAGLRLLFELETRKNAGRVSGAEFKSYKDAQDKMTKLDCIIYIQNLISY